MVLLKCAGDVQKVPTHNSLHQQSQQTTNKINFCLHNHLNNNIANDVWILKMTT